MQNTLHAAHPLIPPLICLGKAQELRAELLSEKTIAKTSKQRAILKRIIANMSMGNDMSSLFPDVLACANSGNLEIKKLVCLYLVNYAKNRQEFTEQALANFARDLQHPNPLVRALTLRTLGYLSMERVYATTTPLLLSALSDVDPYVRKTAVISCLKLYAHDKALFDEHRLMEKLIHMLTDTSPAVVANTVAVLTELSERSPDFTLVIDFTAAQKLISCLTECSEWGQVYILEALMYYIPQHPSESEQLYERVVPRLSHANSAVVLCAVKFILYLTNYMQREEDAMVICRKLAPPLVTLLNGSHEVQYVTLRNILLMIQRFPILQSEMNVFFCKYDDPIYIKTTKLEIMLYLTNETNAKQVLQELKEYASEVDVEFARKAVRSIGMLALRVASCTTDCVHILLDLTRTRVGYVVQESIIVMRDVFRKYPNKYESAIGVLCENLEELTEPEAKAAIIWIIGQYSDRIDNAGFVLEGFLEDFPDEASQVKLALLTAIIKLFIKRPTVGQDLIPRVLKYATEMTDDPDLRDRGYMYWRLLSTNPEAAKAVVLSDRPHITHIIEGMEKFLLEELLLNLSSIASVYHKSPLSFVQYAKHRYLPASDALREKGSALDTAHMALVVKEQRIGFDPLPSTSAAAVYDLLDLNDEDVD